MQTNVNLQIRESTPFLLSFALTEIVDLHLIWNNTTVIVLSTAVLLVLVITLITLKMQNSTTQN